MPKRPDIETRTFEDGWLHFQSDWGKTNSFFNPIGVWSPPGYRGVVQDFGPVVSKETVTDSATAPKVVSGIVAKDTSGNVLRVVHDLIAGKVKELNANGTLGSQISGSPTVSTSTPVSFVVYNDKVLCFDGETTPFQIDISAKTATDIGLTQPSVTNASTALADAENGRVKGIVKYYLSRITKSGTDITEGALSVAFGEIECGEGDKVDVDLTHADFFTSSGTITTTDAAPATTLIDSGATFQTDGVEVGMVVQNTVDNSFGFVTSIDSETQITHSKLRRGTDNNWDTSDTYKVGYAFYLYRTYANREAPNFVRRVFGGNTYTDNKPDDALGDLPRLHGDAPPAAITAAAAYNDVVYGLAGNLLYYSDPGEEESWWTATDGNIINLDRGDGDTGTALYVEADGVVVFKEQHIYKLLGASPEDFQVVPVVAADAKTPTVGTPSINTMTGFPGGAFFFHEQNFYVYSLGRVREASDSISRALRWADDINATTDGAIAYDPRLGVIYCGVQSKTPFTNTAAIWVFDVKSGRWLGKSSNSNNLSTGLVYDPEQMLMFYFERFDSGASSDYQCLSIVDNSGGSSNVIDLDTQGGGALGYTAELRLPTFYGRSPFNTKRFLWLELEAEATTALGTLTLEFDVDQTVVYDQSETDAFVGDKTKYRFNLGQYGLARHLDARIKFDRPLRIYQISMASQEFPSRSL